MAGFVFRLSVILAVSTGSAGFVLTVFAWHLFKGAPFGRIVALLIPFMAAFTIYHALLLVAPNLPLLALTIESFAFALIVVFVGFMVRLHYQRLRTPQNEVPSQ
jgi:hypothetical protein